MFNWDAITNENNEEHNKKDHFIEHSNTMNDIYNNIDNPKNGEILIVFDDMVADIMTNKKFQAIMKELFVRCRKLNISIVFITQSYFCSKRSLIKFYTLLNNEDLQQTAINHSTHIDYKDFMKIYRKCTGEPYSFLTNDTTLPANNSLRFRKNLLDSL